jgi:hypothetical protein
MPVAIGSRKKKLGGIRLWHGSRKKRHVENGNWREMRESLRAKADKILEP